LNAAKGGGSNSCSAGMLAGVHATPSISHLEGKQGGVFALISFQHD
jgi:hypothetical protein